MTIETALYYRTFDFVFLLERSGGYCMIYQMQHAHAFMENNPEHLADIASLLGAREKDIDGSLFAASNAFDTSLSCE